MEDRWVPTTFSLVNSTGLSATQGFAWVAGFNGGGSSGLQPTGGGQATFSSSTQAFYQIGSGTNQINSITLNSGGGRLIFVVSLTQPPTLTVGQGSFTPPPYPSLPSVLPPGPQDFFEFGFNGNDDLTAVQGFGLPMYFTDPTIGESYGVQSVSRDAIGTAYTQFMAADPQGSQYSKLLYAAPAGSGISVPLGQFLEIVDPFDWVNVNPTDPLASYWDTTLTNFFQDGNFLSINLNAGSPTNIYSGTSANGTYTLSNGTNTYTFSNPGTGLAGAKYVFGQAFATTPAPDQGLLQDSIWQALCRGVALDGVSKTSITNGETTTAWNNVSNWYTQHTSTAFPSFTSVYDTYAKFLHYSDANGKDSRVSGAAPIYLGNSAYGFSEDENPLGPYTGGQVPSKTIAAVGANDTVTITLGAWTTTTTTSSITSTYAVGAGSGFAPQVKLYDAQSGALKREISAFSPSFTGGVRVDTADVNHDGVLDLIAGAGPSGGPHVRVFDGITGQQLAGPLGSFLAFDANFHGGVYVAGGDVNADGFADVIVGADAGGGPHVKAFGGRDGVLLYSFMAFDPKFTGGVRVGAGDINGDGRGDMIAAAGPGGGPHVRVFDGASGLQLAGPLGSFFAFDMSFHGGTYVTAADLNGDRQAEVVVGAGAGSGPAVKVYDGKTAALPRDLLAFDPSFGGGVSLSIADANNDGRPDLVAGAASDGGPHVRLIDFLSQNPLGGVFAYPVDFRGGVSVG